MVDNQITAPVPMVKNPDTGELEPMRADLVAQISPQPIKPNFPSALNGNGASEDERDKPLPRSQIIELNRPRFMKIYVEAWDRNVLVQAMTAAQSDQQQALQNTTVRLKRDGSAEYDARLNQLRAQIVCDHTFWMDGTKVFDQPTDPLMLQESDNSVVSLLFGAIDDMSSTTREQLDAAKKGFTTIRRMS